MKKSDAGKKVSIVIWICMLLLVADIVVKGLSLDASTVEKMFLAAQQKAIRTYLPGVLLRDESGEDTAASWLLGKIEQQLPFSASEEEAAAGEDRETSSQIIAENSEFLQAKLLEENQGAETLKEEEEEAKETGQQEETRSASAASQERAPVTDIPLERFQDFNYVLSNFYTVDKSTSINSEQLNAPALIQKDLRMQTENDQPQILIYHSHSQEEFIDSVPGDPSTTIVGVGEYLAQILRDTYGYNVIHVTDVFDVIDGKLDRNQAYTLASERVSEILEENPSVEVVIDLHRDGVADDKRLVTNIDGKETAKVMFLNGLSRTSQNGEISYLPNPYIEDNLAFSLQMMLEAKKYYPDFGRTIYLRGYRYNLHLRPKTLLVECGAQTNTLQEEKNAMEPLADILNRVLSGT